MSWQATLLRDNFQEIYHSLHASKVGTVNLIANFSGRRVYDSTRGWGRIWLWFYRIVDWLTQTDMRLEKLKKAILTTYAIFHRQLPAIEKHGAAYESYLKLAGNGYAVVEDKYHAARRAILFWNRSYAPFLKLMQRIHSPKLEKLFRLTFKGRKQPAAPADLWIDPEAAKLKACRHVIDVEGMTGGPLPLEVFKKIFKKKPLNAIDGKNLNRWISKINKVPDSVRHVHGMACAIAERYAKGAEGEQHPQWAILESFLEDKGCTVFQQQDAKHTQWRRSLKNGTVLKGKRISYVLGRELLSSDASSDNTRVFALERPLGQVLLAAQNRSALALRSFKRQPGNDFAIEPVQLLDVDVNGLWATMEQLRDFGSRTWMSGHNGISGEDRPLLNSLTAFLSSMVKHNCTPAGFSTKEIMFDSLYRLRSLRIMRKDSFDFNALEDFTRECAGGNAAVFQHLMSESGLAKHPAARFYCELLANALKGDETAVEDLAGMHKIGDPKVVDRGTALIREVLALRSQLSMKMYLERPNIDLKAIRSTVESLILSCHLATKCYGTLWPTLGKEVIDRF